VEGLSACNNEEAVKLQVNSSYREMEERGKKIYKKKEKKRRKSS
jgi:hypothetical protein